MIPTVLAFAVILCLLLVGGSAPADVIARRVMGERVHWTEYLLAFAIIMLCSVLALCVFGAWKGWLRYGY